MNKATRLTIGAVALLIFGVGAYGLISNGVYGLCVFIVLPIAIGGLASWIFQPKSGRNAIWLGAVTIVVALTGFLVLGLEGLICLVMAAPLAIPLASFGSWLVYRMSPAPTTSVAMMLMLFTPSVVWDVKARPDVFKVQSSVEIAAPPEKVWQHVITFSELPEPHEWFFRAGLAYPIRARIQGSGPGAVRYCEFSTGPFVEPIEVWDEPHLLRFRVTENPAPMNEWSPYANVMPKHLHGYFVSKQGQFSLTALPNGHTLLEGTTWYQHGLWPGRYWSWWSQAIIHQIHMRVLNHIRTLSESPV